MSDKIKCVDQEGKFHEFSKEELEFRPSVYGVLIEDGKILLSPQWDGFDIPGGGIEIDETIDACLKREFWEETGLEIEVGEIVHAETSFFVLPNVTRPVNSILMYYICKKVGGEISDKNFDKFEKEYASKAQWIELEKVESLKFLNSIDTVNVIEKAKKIIGI